MNKKLFAFSINKLEQAEIIILQTQIYKIKPILHIKNYIVKGFGINFILFFRDLLISKFGKSSFKLFVDCGFDSSLGIAMSINKIDLIKLRGNSEILSKIENIAKKNKVLLNPPFNIVDCRFRKKINLKLHNIYSKDKK